MSVLERKYRRNGYVAATAFVLVILLTWKQLSILERLLMIVPQISSTITDLEITMTVRMNSSEVFTRAPTTDTPTLPGLIPLRNEAVEMLNRIANANIKTVPFTISITAETTPLLVRTPLLLLEYIPASYNTPQASALLPKRMALAIETARSTSFMGSPETRRVLGEDDLRFAANYEGIRDAYMDVVGMEQMKGLMMPLAAARGGIM